MNGSAQCNVRTQWTGQRVANKVNLVEPCWYSLMGLFTRVGRAEDREPVGGAAGRTLSVGHSGSTRCIVTRSAVSSRWQGCENVKMVRRKPSSVSWDSNSRHSSLLLYLVPGCPTWIFSTCVAHLHDGAFWAPIANHWAGGACLTTAREKIRPLNPAARILTQHVSPCTPSLSPTPPPSSSTPPAPPHARPPFRSHQPPVPSPHALPLTHPHHSL